MNDDEEGQATAIRLQRLGVPIAKEAVPTYHDLGLASVVDEATEWQVLRAGAWFWGGLQWLGWTNLNGGWRLGRYSEVLANLSASPP